MSNNPSSSSELNYSDENAFDSNTKSKRKTLAKKLNIKSKDKNGKSKNRMTKASNSKMRSEKEKKR